MFFITFVTFDNEALNGILPIVAGDDDDDDDDDGDESQIFSFKCMASESGNRWHFGINMD